MEKKKKTPKWIAKVWLVFGYVYLPVYFIFWLLLKIVRLLLAFVYCGMLEFGKAHDIVKYLFTNGK